MRLAVPLSAPGEARILFDAGAAEFYCGLQTEEWQAMFGNHDSISRRQGRANLSTYDELAQLVAETDSLGAPLFLTLNGCYSEKQLPIVLQTAEAFQEMGGAGVMVADISLLILLKKRDSRLIRGLSLLAAVSNRSAMGFYNELGVERVVFPRFLSPDQIGMIMKHYPRVQAEAIVWIDKCRFIDGYCRFLHTVAYQDYAAPKGATPKCYAPKCDAPKDDAPKGDAPKDDAPKCEPPKGATPMRRMYAYDTNYRLPACFELLGTPPGNPACAACHMQALEQAGVSIFKLGGRGRAIDVRLSGTRFLSAASGKSDAKEIRELYHQTFGAPCVADVCYYG